MSLDNMFEQSNNIRTISVMCYRISLSIVLGESCLVTFKVFNTTAHLYSLISGHLIFRSGISGIVSTSSSDLTISFVAVLYFIKCGVFKCAL